MVFFHCWVVPHNLSPYPYPCSSLPFLSSVPSHLLLIPLVTFTVGFISVRPTLLITFSLLLLITIHLPRLLLITPIILDSCNGNTKKFFEGLHQKISNHHLIKHLPHNRICIRHFANDVEYVPFPFPSFLSPSPCANLFYFIFHECLLLSSNLIYPLDIQL